MLHCHAPAVCALRVAQRSGTLGTAAFSAPRAHDDSWILPSRGQPPELSKAVSRQAGEYGSGAVARRFSQMLRGLCLRRIRVITARPRLYGLVGSAPSFADRYSRLPRRNRRPCLCLSRCLSRAQHSALTVGRPVADLCCGGLASGGTCKQCSSCLLMVPLRRCCGPVRLRCSYSEVGGASPSTLHAVCPLAVSSSRLCR